VRVQPLDLTTDGDPHPIKRLARLALPEPLREADVAEDFDRWIRDNVPSERDRIGMFDRFGTPPLTQREHALFTLLSILAIEHGAWPLEEGCGRAIRCLEEIQRHWAPSDPVSSYLRGKAAAFVAQGFRCARGEPGRLLSFLNGAPLRVCGDGTAALAFGVTAPVSDLIFDFRDDAFALHSLRSMVEGDRTAFDAAVLAQAEILAPAIERGVARLFERCAPPPGDYLAAFRDVLSDERWLPTLLGKLEGRADLRDRVGGMPAAAEWLRAIAGARAWKANDIRRLVRLEPLFDDDPEAFIAAIVSGVRALEGSEPASAVFAALSLLHLARRRRAVRSELADAEREEAFVLALLDLPSGEMIVRLHAQLADLPMDIPGARAVWRHLGNAEKGLWQWRIRAVVGDDRALRRGLAEFLLAWMSQDVYRDVERLVVDLLPPAQELDVLRTLAQSCDRLTSLRAGCLAREMTFGLPD